MSAATYLIYGGSGGIGAATARLLRARGCNVHAVGRDRERLIALASELGVTWTAGDVSDPELFARATAEAGPVLAGVMYAVGTITLRPLARLTADDFRQDMQVNAIGAALAVQAALPALKASPDGAAVLLFSSVAALQGFPQHASIAMAKSAVVGLTLSLAAELAPRIRVNAIAPSLTRTPLAKNLLANEAMATAIAGMHAANRLGTPEDIAGMAAFLLAPETAWITGQVISVDGGRSSVHAKN